MALPLAEGAAHETLRVALPETSAGAAGVAGAPGVSADAGPYAPSPCEFPARTFTWYSLPGVSPVIVAVVAVEVPSAAAMRVCVPAELAAASVKAQK